MRRLRARSALRRASFVLFVLSAFAFGGCLYLCTFCLGKRVHVDAPMRVAAIAAVVAIATSMMGLVLQRRAKAPVIEWITVPRDRRR